MAFWGVEVKPGKPITHSCEKARGRLRISQATLGFGVALKRSVVQCNVGNRSPVLLCALLPGQTESSHIELEFEEADDVVFSVIGPRSVYLTGYYVCRNRQSNSRSDTESYGVDIENTPTDGSNYNSDDGGDGYEDSFIDDDELQVSSPGSPVFVSKGMDEVTSEKYQLKDKKGCSKLRKKKQWVFESDDDANSPKKEDEDGFSLSLYESRRDVKTTTCDGGEKIDQVTDEMDDEAKDDGIDGSETKQNVDPLEISDKIEREIQPSLDEEGTENNGKNETLIDGKDKMQSLDLIKPKKKRKECPLTEKTSKVQMDNEDPTVPREHKDHEAALADLMGHGEDHLVASPNLDSANGQKLKKRRNELLEGELAEGTDEKFQNITEDFSFKQGSLHVDGVTEHLPAAYGEYELQQKPKETSMEKCGDNVEGQDEACKEGQDEVMQEVHADGKTDDLSAANGENNKEHVDSNMSSKSELLANNNQPGKIKKKKKKTQGKKDLNMSATQMSVNQGNEDESTKIVPIDSRTLSNGLTMEELGSGPPGGKVAVPGKKIKIYYTGMLKESGHVYDSNVGKSAFKFQLGDEEFIDGWNVGIDGMRVGDKRRLIIPPSMGFGDRQIGENVPPNSWLIYDIELSRKKRGLKLRRFD